MESLVDDQRVAQMLSVSPETLKRWRQLGSGPLFVRVGPRAVRYRPSDIAAWLESTRVRAGELSSQHK